MKRIGRMPYEKYRMMSDDYLEKNPLVGEPCENSCDNCIKFEHPDDGSMSCTIFLGTYRPEFIRATNSIKFDGYRPDGYGWEDPQHLSWMELFALIRMHKRFTELYGCGLFEKKDRAYVYDV